MELGLPLLRRDLERLIGPAAQRRAAGAAEDAFAGDVPVEQGLPRALERQGQPLFAAPGRGNPLLQRRGHAVEGVREQADLAAGADLGAVLEATLAEQARIGAQLAQRLRRSAWRPRRRAPGRSPACRGRGGDSRAHWHRRDRARSRPECRRRRARAPSGRGRSRRSGRCRPGRCSRRCRGPRRSGAGGGCDPSAPAGRSSARPRASGRSSVPRNRSARSRRRPAEPIPGRAGWSGSAAGSRPRRRRPCGRCRWAAPNTAVHSPPLCRRSGASTARPGPRIAARKNGRSAALSRPDAGTPSEVPMLAPSGAQSEMPVRLPGKVGARRRRVASFCSKWACSTGTAAASDRRP